MDRCFGAAARPGKTCEPKAPSMYLDAQVPVLVVRCHPFSFFFIISFSMAGAKPKTPRSVFFAWPVSSFHDRGAKPTPRCDLSFFLSLLRLHSQSPQQTAATVKFLSSSVNCGCIFPFFFCNRFPHTNQVLLLNRSSWVCATLFTKGVRFSTGFFPFHEQTDLVMEGFIEGYPA